MKMSLKNSAGDLVRLLFFKRRRAVERALYYRKLARERWKLVQIIKEAGYLDGAIPWDQGESR